MSTVPANVAQHVRERARGRCEYCRMDQRLQGATFHVEHILPRAAGGTDDDANLALACPSCNLRKSNRTTAIDPESGNEVRLFHPRQDRWDEHFEFIDVNLRGKTPTGRATVTALDTNNERRQAIREMERTFGLFPE